jgi:hypothetical protein
VNRNVAVISLAAAGLTGVLVGAAIVFMSLKDAPENEESAAVPVTGVAPASPEPTAGTTPETSTLAPAPAPARRRAVAEPVPARPVEAPAPAAPAVPTAGLLRIDSDVPGAQVFIDRQFVGSAPAVAENVAPGTHQLNVSAPGFDSVATSVEVSPGEREIVVRLRDVRLDSAVEVVHKHGIGSCRGRLVATPQGIRYETANKGDAFTSTLQDLETFQVDYLEKNLRIKLAKGRQFNFSDPEGNADRLFVFHRDVDKARERLRKGDPPATP